MGWRWIFFASAAVSVVGMLMVRGTPESKAAAGNITLFAFDAGEELSEHTAPCDALALTLSGALILTIGSVEVRAAPQTIVLMPANVPHAVLAVERRVCC